MYGGALPIGTTGRAVRISYGTSGAQGLAAWTDKQFRLKYGFSAVFNFQAGGNQAEGFAFVLQSSSGAAIGNAGFNLGYDIPMSIAAEFDYSDSSSLVSGWEPSGIRNAPTANHIVVNTKFTDQNTASFTNGALGRGNAAYPTKCNAFGTTEYVANVTWSRQLGTFTVRLRTIAQSTFSTMTSVSVSATQWDSMFPQGVGWVGFTSGTTGATTSDISVTNFRLFTVPITAAQTNVAWSTTTVAAATSSASPQMIVQMRDQCGDAIPVSLTYNTLTASLLNGVNVIPSATCSFLSVSLNVSPCFFFSCHCQSKWYIWCCILEHSSHNAELASETQ